MTPFARARRAGRPCRRDDFATWPAVKPGRMTFPAWTTDLPSSPTRGEDVPLLSIVPARSGSERDHS